MRWKNFEIETLKLSPYPCPDCWTDSHVGRSGCVMGIVQCQFQHWHDSIILLMRRWCYFYWLNFKKKFSKHINSLIRLLSSNVKKCIWWSQQYEVLTKTHAVPITIKAFSCSSHFSAYGGLSCWSITVSFLCYIFCNFDITSIAHTVPKRSA